MSAIVVGQRYRTLNRIAVRCWWWYDTVAILADYSDCTGATLERNRSLTVVDIDSQDRSRIFCTVDDGGVLERQVVPTRYKPYRWWRIMSLTYVGFQVEVAASDLERNCELVGAGRES